MLNTYLLVFSLSQLCVFLLTNPCVLRVENVSCTVIVLVHKCQQGLSCIGFTLC